MGETKSPVGEVHVGDEKFSFEVEDVSKYSFTAHFSNGPPDALEFKETSLLRLRQLFRL